jgi:hypothetical protein
MTDLNSLIPPGVTLSDARAINDQGQIAANGQDTTTGQIRAYLLTPDGTSVADSRFASPRVAGFAPGTESHASFAVRADSQPPAFVQTVAGGQAMTDQEPSRLPIGSGEYAATILVSQAAPEQSVDSWTNLLVG